MSIQTDSSGAQPLDRATAEADRLQAEATKDAARQDIRQDVTKERMLAQLATRTDLTQKDQRKRKKSFMENANRVRRGQMGGNKMDGKKDGKAIRNKAAEFAKRNPELNQGKLERLARDHIKQGDSAEDILDKMEQLFEDASNADEALEFLSETTEGELQDKVKEARNQLNEKAGRDVRAGRNIGTEARRFSEEGLGSPTGLRDMYRDLVGNPRDCRQLFKEMSGRFNFDELKKVSDFLFHSLGKDLKSQGPSIPRALLHRLLTETRSLQAVLGVYSFFRARMGLVRKLFSQNGLPVPKNLNFETLSKGFMELVQDRYPSPDKVLKQAGKLGIRDTTLGKIVAFSTFRDAVREVALDQIYLSVQQRDEVLNAILEGLDDLEDELEEEEELADDEMDLGLEEDEGLNSEAMEIDESGGAGPQPMDIDSDETQPPKRY